MKSVGIFVATFTWLNISHVWRHWTEVLHEGLQKIHSGDLTVGIWLFFQFVENDFQDQMLYYVQSMCDFLSILRLKYRVRIGIYSHRAFGHRCKAWA